ADEPLPVTQEDIHPNGHAIEARVYAEDPGRDLLPTGGRVLLLREPGPPARVDSGPAAGTVVGSDYDPMLSKVIAWAPDRTGALHALDRALSQTAILGVTTNVPFLRALLAHPAVAAGDLDTGLIERHLAELVPPAEVPGAVLATAALVFHHGLTPAAPGPWEVADGWRIGAPAWTTWRLAVRGEVHAVR